MAAKNLINEDSVDKYFDEVFGFESKHASADQFQHHLDSLEQNDKFSDAGKIRNMATLYRHAGIMLLEHENSVRAQMFLEKSVRLYVTVEKLLKKDNCFCGKNLEAKIFLARCWVRNYQNIQEASNVLQYVVSLKSRTSQIQDVLNTFNAYTTLVELILMHKTQLVARIPSMLTNLKNLSQLIFGLRCSGELRRKILLDVCVLELEFNKNDRSFCETRFCSLPVRCNNNSHFLYLFSKAVLRYGKGLADAMHGLVDVCNEAGKRGDVEWNACSFANAYYVIGESYFAHFNEEAITTFEKCFTLRREYLGSKHVLTNQAQFQLGRSRVQFRDKSLPLEHTGLLLMKKAVANFNSINCGKFEFNSFALEILARLLAFSGCFKKSVFYYQKSFESANLSCYRQKVVSAFRKLDLAKIFQQYNQWADAIQFCSSFLDEIPEDNYSVQVAHCQSLMGYCYFKLGRGEEADEKFKTSRMLYTFSPNDDAAADLQVLILEMKVLEMEFAYCGLLQKWRAENIYNEIVPILKHQMLDASDTIWNQLGWYYEEVKSCLSSALDCYKMVLEKREKVFIHRHPLLCQVLLSLSRVTLHLNDLKDCQIYSARCIKQICSLPSDYPHSTFYLYSITQIVESVISRQRHVNKSYAVFVNYADRFYSSSLTQRIGCVALFLLNVAKNLFCDSRHSVELEEKLPSERFLLPGNSILRDGVLA